MSIFKPTLLLALDPYSMAFCQAVDQEFKQSFPQPGILLETRGIFAQNSQLSLIESLENLTEIDFNLENKIDYLEPINSENFDLKNLENELVTLLQQTREQHKISQVQLQGIEVSKERRILLIISAIDPQVRQLIIKIAHLIRWLFNRRFGAESYSLETIILLPGLFVNPQREDYGNAYALLKQLEASQFTTSIPTFDRHWLLDSCNDQGIQMGNLEANLANYIDLIIGFLSCEDSLGMMVSEKRINGKLAVYSTFGYGELNAAIDQGIARLTNQLVKDILDYGFLQQQGDNYDNYRQLLLKAQRWIVKEEFTKLFHQLGWEKNKRIWQDFNPKLYLKLGEVKEYLQALQQEYQNFEQTSLIRFKDQLEISHDQILKQIKQLLDQEIETWLNDSVTGLDQTIKILKILINPLLTMELEILGELPLNLISQRQKILAALDGELNISLSHSESQNLLKQIQNLRHQIERLEDEIKNQTAKGENPSILGEELVTIQQQLQEIEKNYQETFFEEENHHRYLRQEAISRKLDKLQENLAYTEDRVGYLDAQLYRASQTVNNLNNQFNQVLLKYLIFYPFILILALGIVFFLGIGSNIIWTLGGILGLGWGTFLLVNIWDVSISRNRTEADREHFKKIHQEACLILINNYNKKAEFQYNIYVQNLRQRLIDNLIKIVQEKIVILSQKLTELKKYSDRLDQTLQEKITSVSAIRRNILTSDHLDAYYQKIIVDPTEEAIIFTQKVFKRSDICQFSTEILWQDIREFAQEYFAFMNKFSLGDILFNQPNLLAENTSQLYLRQLYETSDPLLQLHRLEGELDQGRSRDCHLWVSPQDRQLFVNYYRQLYGNINTQITNNSSQLKILTRCLGFPAYFIASLEFYRECYDQTQIIEVENRNLPDLIPTEMIVNREIQEVWRELLMAIALNIVTQDHHQNYYLGNYLLGKDRQKIAEKLSLDFSSQSLYLQLQQSLDEQLSNELLVYQKTEYFMNQQTDLDELEKKLLTSILTEYNPLN